MQNKRCSLMAESSSLFSLFFCLIQTVFFNVAEFLFSNCLLVNKFWVARNLSRSVSIFRLSVWCWLCFITHFICFLTVLLLFLQVYLVPEFFSNLELIFWFSLITIKLNFFCQLLFFSGIAILSFAITFKLN